MGMSLLGNYSVILKSPARFLSGTSVSSERANYNGTADMLNRFYGDQRSGMYQNTAIPSGYVHPATWAMPRTAGGLASFKELTAAISETDAELVSGKGLEASLTAAIDITDADLGLIVSLEAAFSASGAFTDAEMSAVAGMVAAISASMSITDAELGAIVGMTAALTASGSLAANNFATAAMSADISSLTELSPASLAQAVWAAIAADNNDAGSMGEKLNDAGSAANPWTEVIEGSLTATEVLRLLLAVAAGKTTIVDNGGGSATVTFRDTTDSKDRVIADMTGSERDSVTLDVSA